MKLPVRLFGIRFLIITAGMSVLLKMSAIYAGFSGYYIAYFLIYGAGILTAYLNCRMEGKEPGRCERILVYVFTALLAVMGTLSDYYIWFLPGNEDGGGLFRLLYRLLLMSLVFAGIYTSIHNILTYIVNTEPAWKPAVSGRGTSKKLFIIAFFLVAGIDMIVLFACKYPGSLSGDSMDQVMQIMTGSYSNHHPFFHTMIIKLGIDIGRSLFGSLNAGIAVYCVIQILFMAVCFGAVLMTMHEISAPGWMIASCLLFYILVPYHIMYSITLWKDVPFAGFVLLVTVYVYRCIKDIGNMRLNMVIFTVAGIGMCIFRSNGFFAFILFTVSCLIIMKKEGRKLLICMISALALSYLLKYVTLAHMDIAQPDTVESLSIPLQQVAKVAASYNDFTPEEREELEKVVDIDEMIKEYRNYLSDPVKELIRKKGDQDYLKDNKLKFLKLYVRIGLRHPVIYTLGWVDQTCGYLNAAGYPNKYWYDSIDPNNYGIERVPRLTGPDRVINEYMWLYYEIPILQLFLCIGIYVWLLIAAIFIFLIKRNRAGLLASIPAFAVILSLLIATPVSAEFRYAYSLFCSLPLLLVIAFRPGEGVKTQ